MKVEELVAQLSKINPDADVWIKTEDGDTEAIATYEEAGDVIIVCLEAGE